MVDLINGDTFKEQARSEGLLQLAARNRIRLLKSGAGAALFSLGVWFGYQELVLTKSWDATVSSQFSDISASIDGYVELHVKGKGEAVDANHPLLAIDNPLLDRREAIELETKLAALDGEIAAANAAVDRLTRLSTQFEARGRSYLRQRSEQLELALSQSQARLDIQQARLTAAQAQLQRVEGLAKEGVASVQQVEDARRDASVAESMLTDATMTIELQRTSLSASKSGVTIGDYSSVDRSYSNQRADEVSLSLAQLSAQLAEKQTHRAALASGLADLNRQLDLQQHRDAAAPARSRVWAMLASNKQWVTRGQTLLRVMDCTRMHVLAYLSRRKFDSVRVGQAAQIELIATGRKFNGHVTLTMGKLPGPGLIEPLAATENYAVLVESNELAVSLREACDTGQRAEVTFLRDR
ncbi:MAG TPA: HlyD family efflux transporter periplasmic adaptor subunit [Polyangiaceae bacterium]|nr:HlyD family efflux transporter periplasmic adaptor subunit [Polyangiaceae bacterium]